MQIKINLEMPKQQMPRENDKRMTKLETAVKGRDNSEILAELKSIKKLLNTDKDSTVENKLSKIENKINSIPDKIINAQSVISKKIDNIDLSSVERTVKSSTNKIIDALMSKVSERPDNSQLEAINRKLSRLSLPKPIYVDRKEDRIVPYPA